MANTYHQVYIQAVFAPKYREAVLRKSIQQEVFGVIGSLINRTGCKTIIVNGVEDHVHAFLGLKPAISISDLMKTVKAICSKHINDEGLTFAPFEWQDGYGAFSYSHSEIHNVYHYVLNQEAHHRVQNFRDEYTGLLDAFGIPYEERYIFDDLI